MRLPSTSMFSSCQQTTRAAVAHAPVSSPAQRSGFKTRLVLAGCLVKSSAGRTGRRTSSPPQLGQTKLRRVWQHCRQNVHSNVHTYASSDSGGRSRSQHSHPGLSSKAIIAPREPFDLDASLHERKNGHAQTRKLELPSGQALRSSAYPNQTGHHQEDNDDERHTNCGQHISAESSAGTEWRLLSVRCPRRSFHARRRSCWRLRGAGSLQA